MQCTYIGWIIPTLGRTYMQKKQILKEKSEILWFFPAPFNFQPSNPIPTDVSKALRAIHSQLQRGARVILRHHKPHRAKLTWPSVWHCLPVSRCFQIFSPNCIKLQSDLDDCHMILGAGLDPKSLTPSPFFRLSVPCSMLRPPVLGLAKTKYWLRLGSLASDFLRVFSAFQRIEIGKASAEAEISNMGSWMEPSLELQTDMKGSRFRPWIILVTSIPWRIWYSLHLLWCRAAKYMGRMGSWPPPSSTARPVSVAAAGAEAAGSGNLKAIDLDPTSMCK